MKISLKIHYPTAEELVEDIDAVGFIKYILLCYMDNIPLEGNKIKGMMDRMYLYNWSIAGMIMYRKILTIEQVQYEDPKQLRSEVECLEKNPETEKAISGLSTEIMIAKGTPGYNDIVDFCNYDFFLSDYGYEIFTEVIKLIGIKNKRYMETEDLQVYQDSGKLEIWMMAAKNRTITYPKSQAQLDGDLCMLVFGKNEEFRKTIHNRDEKGVVGWLEPTGKFIRCNWAEHSKTAYEILEEDPKWEREDHFMPEDCEQELEKRGYLKFWKMADDWGVGSGDDIRISKPQIRWFEKNIGIIANRQITMFELMAKK